jgi:hypothetical protein
MVNGVPRECNFRLNHNKKRKVLQVKIKYGLKPNSLKHVITKKFPCLTTTTTTTTAAAAAASSSPPPPVSVLQALSQMLCSIINLQTIYY